MSINISQSNSALSSGNNATPQTASASAVGNSASNAPAKTDEPGTAKDISISTRAEKLQKLSKEFFPAGPQSLKITAQFVQRLHEYGFISAAQAEKLSTQVTSSQAKSGSNTVGELKGVIEKLSSKLEKESANHSLIDVLQKSKSVLDSFDETLVSPKQTNYTDLINKLTEFSTSSDTSVLSQNDKNTLEKLAVTLSIADKLGPVKSTTKEINQYLAILNR